MHWPSLANTLSDKLLLDSQAMEWAINEPTDFIHSTFTPLGTQTGSFYTPNNDCLGILADILANLSTEDKSIRTFRRALGLSQAISTDLIPILINVKDDIQIMASTIRVLVNLTLPVDSLLTRHRMSQDEAGMQIITDLNQMLFSAKESFVEARATQAVIDFIRQVMQKDANKLSVDECESINNCLLLLRNVLHIPDHRHGHGSASNVCQNQILWNLFTQSVDTVLIHLMTCSKKSYWGVTMVQLIALIYKDQHVGTMQKLLNLWFEASLSESSDDNESNTSPPDQGSGDSSPMLTSDPTSDSSDTGSSRKKNRKLSHCSSTDLDSISSKQHSARHHHSKPKSKSGGKGLPDAQRKSSTSTSRRSSLCKSVGSRDRQSDGESGISSHGNRFSDVLGGQKRDSLTSSEISSHGNRFSDVPGGQKRDSLTSSEISSHGNRFSDVPGGQKRDSLTSSEISDYGYATQAEKDQSNSTSSNEDEGVVSNRCMKPVHQKPHMIQKTRFNAKNSDKPQDKKEMRRKKLGKRSRRTNLNMKALMHHTPSDEDISNLLKEFTVDFLLKAYGSLVQDLYNQLLNNKTQIDTSHFFWLVTYFLKFAAQLELDLDHISSVLTFDIVSYLTYEGVYLFEQIELASQHEKCNIASHARRMHLVITAIREFLQTVHTYKKIANLNSEDTERLLQLQLQIGSCEDLRCLFVLLLQQYNPAYQNRQYLRDLIVTNHILLQFLDNVKLLPGFQGSSNMAEHIQQFATVEVMCQYGLLLEDFQENDPFINDCIFTMMHHVSGDMDQVAVLFQPSILKTFSQICEMDFDICDDWSDLIEYVMYKFINIPRQNAVLPQVAALVGDEVKIEPLPTPAAEEIKITERSKEDIDDLYWYYVQSSKSSDPVGKVIELYEDNGNTHMSRIGIIQQLLIDDVIDSRTRNDLMDLENVNALTVLGAKSSEVSEQQIAPLRSDELAAVTSAIVIADPSKANECFDLDDDLTTRVRDEIKRLCNHLLKEKKGKSLVWLQNLLIEACFINLNLTIENVHILNSSVIMEPIPYHYAVMKQSIPIVPWNSDQKSILLYEPFILLLHKIGINLPENSSKAFARIPHLWTAEVLFGVAEQLGPINAAKLKFDPVLLKGCPRAVIIKDSPIEPVLLSRNAFAVQNLKAAPSVIRFTPASSGTTQNWLKIVASSQMT